MTQPLHTGLSYNPDQPPSPPNMTAEQDLSHDKLASHLLRKINLWQIKCRPKSLASCYNTSWGRPKSLLKMACLFVTDANLCPKSQTPISDPPSLLWRHVDFNSCINHGFPWLLRLCTFGSQFSIFFRIVKLPFLFLLSSLPFKKSLGRSQSMEMWDGHLDIVQTRHLLWLFCFCWSVSSEQQSKINNEDWFSVPGCSCCVKAGKRARNYGRSTNQLQEFASSTLIQHGRPPKLRINL